MQYIKKSLLLFSFLSFCLCSVFAQETTSVEDVSEAKETASEIVVDAISSAGEGVSKTIEDEENTQVEDEGEEKAEKKKRGGTATVPAAKKPIQPTKEEIEEAAKKEDHKSDNYVKKVQDTFAYGLESEISDQIDTLVKNEDKRFVNDIYNMFQLTENNAIREKVLAYFTTIKDPCIEDYAVTIVNDPYDTKKSIVDAVFKYISAVKCKAATPAVVKLLEDEAEDYFNGCINALGEIGGEEEAQFLADYLDKDDLTTGQRQELMKVLGKLKASSTWSKLRDIVEDENENSYVRMYAAEALGAMEESASIDVLAEQYSSTSDANLRVYLVKGLSYFKDAEAQKIILQAIRDSFYKVRLEAIETAKKQDMKNAVPYLVYRAKTDSETVVKNACYPAIAALNTAEGNEFLVSLVTDKKPNDTVKSKAAAALLKEGHAGDKEVVDLAIEVCKTDAHKQLRYALGKEMAKYERKEFARACTVFLESKDVSTQGTGLDMWAKGKYGECKAAVEKIADSTDSRKKPTVTAKKAMRLLGREIPEDK